MSLNKIIKTKKDEEVAEHIKKNPLLVFKFRKFFNKLCRKCKRNAMKAYTQGGTLPFKEYCETCKKKANEVFKR